LNGVIEPHGEMRDGTGRLIAGIGRQGGDWVLVVGGQVMGRGSSAADVMAMLHQLADMRQAEGDAVMNTYSSTFKAAAERDAEEEGMSLTKYIERAREEMTSCGLDEA
jgi:hypothetical protein